MTETADMAGISLQTRVSHAPELVSADLGGETALLDPATGIYYGLNQVGARIWELLATPRLVSEVAAILCQEFEVEQEECEQDVMALLSLFQERRLLIIEEAMDA
jgi:hypothetical protein